MFAEYSVNSGIVSPSPLTEASQKRAGLANWTMGPESSQSNREDAMAASSNGRFCRLPY